MYAIKFGHLKVVQLLLLQKTERVEWCLDMSACTEVRLSVSVHDDILLIILLFNRIEERECVTAGGPPPAAKCLE